jgi:hypothetical protein
MEMLLARVTREIPDMIKTIDKQQRDKYVEIISKVGTDADSRMAKNFVQLLSIFSRVESRWKSYNSPRSFWLIY